MSKPVEFSQFFRLLNSLKEGSKENKDEFFNMLSDYEKSTHCDSHLDQLGQTFLYVGVKSLFDYAGTEDLYEIGLITQETWEEMSKKSKADIAPYLANKMIAFAKEEKIARKISDQWSVSKREINKNIMNMARYITEGILDSIE